MRSLCCLAGVLLFLTLAGCSHSSSPVLPRSELYPQTDLQNGAGPHNRYLLGFWDIAISADRSEVTLTPERTSAFHLNAVYAMEVFPCTDCLSISNLRHANENVYSFDLTLRHPVPDSPDFALVVFDVRGVVITPADYLFPQGNRQIGWSSDSPRLLFPDGYTSLFNPTEFPPTIPEFLGYYEGKYATGGGLNATLNPYMAFETYNPRNPFSRFSSETQTYVMYLPDGPVNIGYAIDASWQRQQYPDEDGLDKFSLEANSIEAYKIDVELVNLSGFQQGEPLYVTLNVSDHQGVDTISTVTLESPEIFNGVIEFDTSVIESENLAVFSGTITNEEISPPGEYPVLVRVQDKASDPIHGPIDAWQVFKVNTKYEAGWARTFGDYWSEETTGIAVADDGSVFACGYVTNWGFFLNRYSSAGDLLWSVEFEGDGSIVQTHSVDLDSDGNVYVSGQFGGFVDFDPGPGTEYRWSFGLYDDCYLLKLTSEGEFVWVRTWGADKWDYCRGLKVLDNGDIYLTGEVTGLVDFDPGYGNTTPPAFGNTDSYLSKFDSDGNFQWVRKWGSWGYDRAYDIDVSLTGNIYITGVFERTTDFDPGPGEEIIESLNYRGDCYLSKFNPEGEFIWVRAWQGWDTDTATGLSVNPNGEIFVTGYFRGNTDFDPGPEEFTLTSNGSTDCYITCLDQSGNLQWAQSWGNESPDEAYDVYTRGDKVMVCGIFSDIVDFNPDPDEDESIASHGYEDFYVSQFDSSGDYLWTQTWGGAQTSELCRTISSSESHWFLGGNFHGVMDFDPGPDQDNHSSYSENFLDAWLMKIGPDGYW